MSKQQGDDEGKDAESKGEGKNNDDKTTEAPAKKDEERKLVAPIDSFFVSHD